MSEQHRKNKRTIIIIFSLSIIPFCIAWYLSSNDSWMGGGTNNGQLITPPVATQRDEYVGFDQFSLDNIKELAGHWVILNIIPNIECSAGCIEAIHKTKQLRLMMNKDLTRIRRAVLILANVNDKSAQQWWKDDIRLLRVKPTVSLLEKIKKIKNKGIPDGMLFIVDPMGNIMMQYAPGFDPYKVKSDLRKLLKISQIG